MRGVILDELKRSADPGYKKFHSNLIPGCDSDSLIGVRVPIMRALARKIAGGAYGDFREYLGELAGIRATERYYEENMLYGMVVGYAKAGWEEFCDMAESFIPMIDNWAVCDSCVSTMKTIRKNRGAYHDIVRKHLISNGEFEKRFAVTVLLDHYINEEYIGTVLDDLRDVDCTQYYTMMAAAWCAAECWLKFPEQTEPLLAERSLDATTQNKTISKIRDSYRVFREEKDRLLKYRIVK